MWGNIGMSDDPMTSLFRGKEDPPESPQTYYKGEEENNITATVVDSINYSPSQPIADYMWDLALIAIGTAIGALTMIFPYVIAIIVISGIVYFAYRAFLEFSV
jgi:hypothetical protein